MTIGMELIVSFVNTIQLYLFIITFAVIIGAVTDTADDELLSGRLLTMSPYLLTFALLNCVFEYINNIAAHG